MVVDRVHELIEQHIREGLNQYFYPYVYPDRNPFPEFVFWPWIERVIYWRHEVPERVLAAYEILTHGITEYDEW